MENMFNIDISKESTMSAQPSTRTRRHRFATETPLRGTATAAQTITAPAATMIGTAAHTVPLPAAVKTLAWSAEEPDDIADPIDSAGDDTAAESARVLPWYLRSGLLVSATAALLVLAAAGLIMTLHRGGASITVPAVKSNSTAPAVAAHVDAPPNTPVDASPPPTATQPVVVDQVTNVPGNPQVSTRHVQLPTHGVAPPASPAPQPTPPTSTPKPVEHWPPHRGTWDKHPTWDSHQPRDWDLSR
jgi:hypothetical protein